MTANDNESSTLREAEAALADGDYVVAEQKFRRYVVEHPDDAAAINRLGVCLARSEQLHEAANAFEKAIELDTGLARAYTNLGNLKAVAGKLEEAEQLHRRALQLDPDMAYAYDNLASVLKRQRRLGEAVKAQKQAARLALRQVRQQEAESRDMENGATRPEPEKNPARRQAAVWLLLALGALIFWLMQQS